MVRGGSSPATLLLADGAGEAYLMRYDVARRVPIDTRRIDAIDVPAMDAVANAREVLAWNRAGSGRTALLFSEIVTHFAVRGGVGDLPLGAAFARDDDPAYEDWRIRAWPDDLRAASNVASPDRHAKARLGTAVAIVRDGKLLLGERIAPYGNGAWQTPGGKPDPGEQLARAAARELLEETALVATRMRYVTAQVDLMPETGVTWRTHFWLADADGDVVNREPDKCASWQWFPFDALPSPLFAIDARTIDAIRALATEP